MFTYIPAGGKKFLDIYTPDEIATHIKSYAEYNESKIADLQERIKKYESETYENDKIRELQERCDELAEQNNHGFPMTKEQSDKARDWVRKHTAEKHDNSTFGCCGGNYEYIFTPTSIGTIGKVKCSACGEEFVFMNTIN